MRNFKSYLINPKVQLKIVMAFAISSFLQFVASAYFISTFFTQFRLVGKRFNLTENHPFFSLLEKQETYLWGLMAAAALLGIVSTLVIGIYLSHKIVGPLGRLKSHLNHLASNPSEGLRPVSFRKGDEFQDLQNSFNNFVSKWDSEKEKVKDQKKSA